MFDISIDVCEAALISSGGDDVPTEVETRCRSRRRLAVVTRRFVSPAGCAPVPLASASRDRS